MRTIKKSLLLVFLCLSTLCVAQKQGIKGKVLWIEGNQMPGPNAKPSEGKGIKRVIHIYEPTTLQQAESTEGVFFKDIKTKLIAKVKSKANGSFCVKLKPGEYSVFIEEENGLFANQFDSRSCIQCIQIEPGKFNELTILVNYKAAY